MRSLKTCALLAMLLAGARPAVAELTYELVDLGTLPGHAFSTAYGINQAGQITGHSTNGRYDDRAFLHASGALTNLGVLPGRLYSVGLRVNDSAQVAGYSGDYSPQNPNGRNHAILYSGGVMRDLGVLPGFTASEAYGLNNKGQVVGYASGKGSFRAFLYSGGALRDLGVPAGAASSMAYAINDASYVAGAAFHPGLGTRAVLYRDGIWMDLGGLPGAQYSVAFDLNNRGQVVGQSGASELHAFLWEAGVMTDLGTLAGLPWSMAYAVNEMGQAVGYGYSPITGQARAFLHSDGEMVDLNSLLPPGSGWVLTQGRDINDAGQIVGVGLYRGQTRAFLLTPTGDPSVPEPSSLVLGGIGGLVLLGYGWRRRRTVTSSASGA